LASYSEDIPRYGVDKTLLFLTLRITPVFRVIPEMIKPGISHCRLQIVFVFETLLYKPMGGFGCRVPLGRPTGGSVGSTCMKATPLLQKFFN